MRLIEPVAGLPECSGLMGMFLHMKRHSRLKALIKLRTNSATESFGFRITMPITLPAMR